MPLAPLKRLNLKFIYFVVSTITLFCTFYFLPVDAEGCMLENINLNGTGYTCVQYHMIPYANFQNLAVIATVCFVVVFFGVLIFSRRDEREVPYRRGM
jgi:quinol-cytochrome oxidoreductase complex cytochrome b subunit